MDTGSARSVLSVLALLVSVPCAPVCAQDLPEPRAREPQRFIASAVLASAGAVGGFFVGAALAPREGRICPAMPGARCSDGTPLPLGVMAGSVLGAAAGATLGARLLGGRQNFLRSAAGAVLGLFVGGAIAGQFNAESDGALAISFVVPTGVFAAWVGR